MKLFDVFCELLACSETFSAGPSGAHMRLIAFVGAVMSLECAFFSEGAVTAGKLTLVGAFASVRLTVSSEGKAGCETHATARLRTEKLLLPPPG